MENLSKILEFVVNHWEVITPVVLWLSARLIKTQKNYDLLEMLLRFIGEKIIPNRVESKYSDYYGKGAGDDYPIIDKKKEDANGGEK